MNYWISIICSLIYTWYGYYKHTNHHNNELKNNNLVKIVFALIKWFSVVNLLSIEPISFNTNTLSLSFNWDMNYLLWNSTTVDSILLLYSVGDFLILFNQNISIFWFALGHIFFLIRLHKLNFLINNNGLLCIAHTTLIKIGCILLVFMLLSHFIASQIQKRSYLISYYSCYIFILHVYLVYAIANNYYGTILFVVSDIMIGFEIKHPVSLLDWPLYYMSLIYMVHSM